MKSTTQEGGLLPIGEAARTFGLEAHVLRHWEALGLLSPSREGGQRRYARSDMRRIAAVIRAKEAGLGLEAIRSMVAGDASVRRSVLREQERELRGRIDRLQDALRLVECALACDHSDVVECPHFASVIDQRIDAGGPDRGCGSVSPAPEVKT